MITSGTPGAADVIMGLAAARLAGPMITRDPPGAPDVIMWGRAT